MASAARSLRLVCRSSRTARSTPTVHAGPKVFVAWKSVASGGGATKESAIKLDNGPKPTPYDHWEEEDKARQAKYRFMAPSNIAKDILRNDPDFDPQEGHRAMDAVDFHDVDGRILKDKDDLRELARPYNRLVQPSKDSFWDDGETDNTLISNSDSDEFEEDDMTDIAHAKLEEHREQRAYARIAIWEMPLLASECCLVHYPRTHVHAQGTIFLNNVPQNMPNLSIPHPTTNPCDSVIPHTWASTTPPRRKSWSNSVRRTLALNLGSN